MKKIVIFLCLIILLLFSILKAKTMSIKEFLYDKNKNHWQELYINKNGNVEYKNKVILKDNFTPLNEENAYQYIEFDILFAAQKIEPKKDCNPADTAKNGRMGCYMDFPNEK